jgi:hypothetical protein
MQEKELDEWIMQIEKDYKALTRIIIEKENMINELNNKRSALIELKEKRKLEHHKGMD